jgi:hypothetical protein
MEWSPTRGEGKVKVELRGIVVFEFNSIIEGGKQNGKR